MPVANHSHKRKKVRGQRVQVERAMRLMPVQEDGHRGNAHMGQAQCDQYFSPPGQIDESSVHGAFQERASPRF
jgi:hypothetical protein